LPVKTTTSDANGKYEFKYLRPTNYYLKIQLPQSWFVTKPNQGSDLKDNDIDNSNGLLTSATINLSAGENDSSWDVGLVKCATISGDVWHDLNMDGIYNPQEKGINGLQVLIIDAMTGATVV